MTTQFVASNGRPIVLFAVALVAAIGLTMLLARGSGGIPERDAASTAIIAVSEPSEAVSETTQRSPIAPEPAPATAIEKARDGWPTFPVGSLGAALAQYHDRPWSSIRTRIEHLDPNADAIEQGFVPWETARLNAPRFLPALKSQIVPVVCARFLRRQSVEEWGAAVLRASVSGVALGRHQALSENDVAAMKSEADGLVAAIAAAVDARYDEIVATEAYKRMPMVGFQDVSRSRGTVVFNMLGGIGGWHCLIEIHDYEIPQVAADILALEALRMRAVDLVGVE